MSKIDFEAASECLKVLAHPVRLKIVDVLLGSPCSVLYLANECGTSQPVMSEHLRLLARCGFIKGVRDGRNVNYEIAHSGLSSLLKCISTKCGD